MPEGLLSLSKENADKRDVMDQINLSLLLPTRGRSQRLKQFVDSAYRTALHSKNTEVVLFIDDDDNSMRDFEYKKLKIKKLVQS